MVEILKCNLVPSGTPFEVKDTLQDNTIKPGSFGFISLVNGPDCKMRNIAFQRAVIIRRGKTGKPRLDISNILTPVFQLPGDIYPKDLIPEEKEEMRYLVDLNLEPDYSINLKSADNINFMAWMLARSLFTLKLTKVNYKSDHQIAKMIGLGNGPDEDGHMPSVWPQKKSLIQKFVQEVEPHFASGEDKYVADLFCNDEARQILVTTLRNIETQVVVPRLEYQRRMCVVMQDALTQIEQSVKDGNIEDKKGVAASIEATREWVKLKKTKITAALSHRLSGIKEKRQLLKF